MRGLLAGFLGGFLALGLMPLPGLAQSTTEDTANRLFQPAPTTPVQQDIGLTPIPVTRSALQDVPAPAPPAMRSTLVDASPPPALRSTTTAPARTPAAASGHGARPARYSPYCLRTGCNR